MKITIIREQTCDALALLIQSAHCERHTRLQAPLLGIINIQKTGDAVVLDIIRNIANKERFSWMKCIDGLELLALHLFIQGDRRIHITKILHGRMKIFTTQLRLKCIKHYRFLAYPLQGSVNPLCGVSSRKRVSSHWNLEHRKPFRVGLLSDIRLQKGSIKSFRVRLHLYFFKQILFVGNEFCC